MNIPECLRTAALCALAGAAAGRFSAQAPHAQVPPSIRASAVRGAPPRMSDEEQSARCVELKTLIAILKPEATSPLKQREVADFERMRGGLACPGAGALQGTWTLVGTPRDGGRAINWTWNLTPITREAGQMLAKEQWGIVTASMCGSGEAFFYQGTLDFKKGPTFNGNDPFQWWIEGTGSVLVCVSSEESGTGWAYQRDANKGRGFHLQVSGNRTALEGDVIPQPPVTGSIRFKAVR